MKLQKTKGMKNFQLFSLAAGCAIAALGGQANAAISSVTNTACNSKLEVTVAGTTRSSTVSGTGCQERALTSAGLALTATSPAGSVTADSTAMVAAGGELFESFVAAAREAAVLLTPNRALMMSRSVDGVTRGVNWNMGLAVQPVAGATNAWLIGTYTLLRANDEFRVVDSVNQSNAALSEVFDPATLRITFNGTNNNTVPANNCSISSYSSWFGYSLTTDPTNTQPNPGDYGLHQAVYAGEGYAGAGGVHKDSVHTFTDCDYDIDANGMLLVTYKYTDGDSVAKTVVNSYYVSSDMRYLVSTVDSGASMHRGFEVGVRVKTISGTQDERNDGVAGTYLFNAPTLELQGATGVLSEPYNQHRNAEKATQCMSRGATVLSTTTSATSGWNTCTWEATNTCTVRGEEGTTPNVSIQHYAALGTSSTSSCRFQVAANGSLSFVVNFDTAEGAQDMTFSGAMADNNESLVLRGKYVGTTMTNPSGTAPQRQIKNDLILTALVGVKYAGSLVADADSDGLNNLAEFMYPNYLLGATVKNDFNNDGVAGWMWKGESNGVETQSQLWQLDFPLFSANYGLPERTFPPVFPDQANWEVVTTGDFNKDGDADIVWRHKSLATWKIWQMENGLRVAQSTPSDFDLAHAWTVVGAGDIDRDGDDDIIFNNATTGAVQAWEMQNYVVVATRSIGTKAGYTLSRIGDFNADGDVDLLFRQNGGDTLITWELQAGGFVAERALANTGTGYSPVCAGDFDGDGDDDIMLVNSSTKQEKWFTMENYARTQQFGGTNDGFVFLGCGDYDGDGDFDSLWQRSSDDQNRIVLQQDWGTSKQTLYTNPFGGSNPAVAGYGFVYRANKN